MVFLSLSTSSIEFQLIYAQFWLGWSPLGILANLPLVDSACAQLPLTSDALASAKFFIPVTLTHDFTPESSHPIMATSFQVHWLNSNICLNWAVPGSSHSHLLLEFQWSNGAKIPWCPGHSPHLPYMFAFFSLRLERWNQNLVLTVRLATTLSLIPTIPLCHKGWAALLFLRLLYASFLL